MSIKLQNYYPQGTTLFYGYPSGEASKFFNDVPPWVEELVASRPLACGLDSDAGMRVVSFAATVRDKALRFLADVLGSKVCTEPDRLITLGESIDESILGQERNLAIIASLQERVAGRLVMAQPFLDDELDYAIDPRLSVELNDKSRMPEIIPENRLPKRLASFSTGMAFMHSDFSPSFPCVVKVSSSSAGDGVFICRDANQYIQAKMRFNAIQLPIFVEAFVAADQDLGVQFGIRPDRTCEIIGVNEQVVDANGACIGGVVRPGKTLPSDFRQELLQVVLPKAAERGWFGIGGFDVRFDGNSWKYIDPNFRPTALSPFIIQGRNGVVGQCSMMAFIGRIRGDKEVLKRRLEGCARFGDDRQVLNVISLIPRPWGYDLNGAVLFDQDEALKENAQALLDLGIQSDTLSSVTQ